MYHRHLRACQIHGLHIVEHICTIDAYICACQIHGFVEKGLTVAIAPYTAFWSHLKWVKRVAVELVEIRVVQKLNEVVLLLLVATERTPTWTDSIGVRLLAKTALGNRFPA